MTITPLIALIGEPLYAHAYGISWPVILVFAFYMVATGLSITAGYHRLFSHRAYRTNAPVRLFFLLFGAAACQNSALKWSADHRDHHAYTEQEKDPYNIYKGFFHAHIGWVMMKGAGRKSFENAKDLSEDPLVMWQYRHYLSLAIFIGGVLPFIIGYFLSDAWGCFLLAGITRTVIVHHSTFLINSLCHWMGRQPYSFLTARDSAIVAFLTYGEGYHNFHHQFQFDYRNGIRWYQWDPTKWLIRGMEMLGWANQLRKASDELIFKARVRVQRELVEKWLARHSDEFRVRMEERVQHAYQSLLTARAKWERLKVEYHSMKDSMDHKRHEIAERMKQEIQIARDHFHSTHQAWALLIQGCMEPAA